MEIYGEYLFLENTVTGLVILYLTGKILGEPRAMKRLLAGSAACGIYGFIIFVPNVPAYLIMSSKLLFSLAVCWITFGIRDKFQAAAGKEKRNVLRRINWRRTGRQTGIFYLVSFVMGGATVGVMYFFSIPGVAYNGSVYMRNPTILLITMGCGLAYIGTDYFIEQLKMKKGEEGLMALVEIVLGGKSLRLVGMVDTGNSLQDPITGKPVLLVEHGAVEELISCLDDDERNRRTRFIPFASVGKEKGNLMGIRPDRISTCMLSGIENEEQEIQPEQWMPTEGILGLYTGQFGVSRGGQHYSVLLHPAVKERRLVYHG